MNIRLLSIVDTIDPTFHVDVAHFFPGDWRFLQNYVLRVPNDDTHFVPE